MATAVERAKEKIADSVHTVSRATNAVADVFDTGIDTVRRMGKHTSDAAEEFMEDTAERIKRHPATTVLMVFTAGFLIGGFVSWLAGRKK